VCGINLILDKKKKSDSSTIQKMADATRHRGPDFSTTLRVDLETSSVFLGINRLAILDTGKAANQPYVSEDGNYLMIFNGEIYNYHDLKNDLLAVGQSFKTHSDGEVLFYLLAREGKAALDQLNGMFAFIFLDKKQGSLLMARDGSGMKPLFYWEDGDYFLVSSEIKGILASGLAPRELDESQIRFYLQFRYPKPPRTFFKEVYQLPPGTAMIKQSGQSDQSWSFSNSNQARVRPPDPKELLPQLEERLLGATLRHLQADVPCGLFLSGGVDSSLLLALIKESGTQRFPTFSLVQSGQEKSFGTRDSYYSRIVAKSLGSSHQEVEVMPDVLNDLDDFIDAIDQPVGDSASLLTFVLSKEAKKSVKVILTGAGADELFTGYNRHWGYYQYLTHYSFLSRFGSPLGGLAKMLPVGFNHPFRKKFQLMKKFLGDIDQDPVKTFILFSNLSQLVSDQNPDYPQGHRDDFVEKHLEMAFHFDRQSYLVSDLLALNDNMSMASGIEMRMPYLDREVCQLVDQLDPTYLISRGRKWMLRKILSKHLSRSVANRPKEGFGLPFGAWIRKPQFYYLFDFCEEKDNPIFKYISRDKVRQTWINHREGRSDNTLPLWSVFVLDRWIKKNF